MVDIHNDNIPALGNTIAADIPDIKENLEFHKDAFQQITSGWSNTSVANLYLNFPGLWYGGNPSNATDTEHDITIAAGQFTLYNGTTYQGFNLSSAITKKIDANWSAGTGQGGFPSGLTLAADTMYYVFIIGNSDGTVDVGFDTDSSATNLLADATGYTFYRIVRDNFAVFTDSSSNIRNFGVRSSRIYYNTAIEDVADTTLTDNTYETGTLTVPPNSIAMVSTRGYSASSTGGLTVQLKDKTTGTIIEAGHLYNTDAPTQQRIGVYAEVCADGSRQIDYALDVFTGGVDPDELYIKTYGYYLQA